MPKKAKESGEMPLHNSCVKNGFNRLNDPELETRANQIRSALTGDNHFPTPLPSAMVMEEIIAVFL